MSPLKTALSYVTTFLCGGGLPYSSAIIGKTQHGTSKMAQYLNVKSIERVLRFPIIYLQNKSLLSVCHVSSIIWCATSDGNTRRYLDQEHTAF